MTFHDLVQMYFERSNALQWYWTIYVVVIGGLLAFSSLRKERDLITTGLVTVLFCFFAYKNLGAIHDVTVQRYAILQVIKESPNAQTATELQSARSLLEPTLIAPAYEGVRNFHVASDLITVAALWAMERRRRNILIPAA
ncbi:MAG TPA: hypothetical protein VK815_12500 [Candidatus Acidoferrales bacterium]|jgi:hypothetical protein|nr:hypothetical protein [Candidatus Acidoferrales bacterium]